MYTLFKATGEDAVIPFSNVANKPRAHILFHIEVS